MDRQDRTRAPDDSETSADWKQFKTWGWSTGALLIAVLTGALVRFWVSNTDAKLGEHDARLTSHDSTFYRNETRLTIMETEHRQLQRERERADVERLDMENRIRILCRESKKC